MGPAPFHLLIIDPTGLALRCSELLDDTQFSRLMEQLRWKMPYHLRAFHCSAPIGAASNPVLAQMPSCSLSAEQILFSKPPAPMRIKDKRRGQTMPIRSKCENYVVAETEDGYGRIYHVDGIASSLITRLEARPITLRQAGTYIARYHRHNGAPKFHKFSVCLWAPGESEPVGVAVASLPKARHQMDGVTLEINRCCSDPRYADVCSNLYARVIRIGRELGYLRFLTYTLPEESGSSLRAVGFRPEGIVKMSSEGWDRPSRPRAKAEYPAGDKIRWVLSLSS